MQSVFNTLVSRPVGTDFHVSGHLLTNEHLLFFTLLLFVHLFFGLLLLHSSMEHCKTCGWCIFKADRINPDQSFIMAIIQFRPLVRYLISSSPPLPPAPGSILPAKQVHLYTLKPAGIQSTSSCDCLF